MRPPSEPEACRQPGSRTAPPTSPSHAGSARSANNPVEEFGSSRRITGFPHTPRVRPDPVTKHGLDRPTPAKPEIILQQGKLFRPSPQGQRCDAPRCKTTWRAVRQIRVNHFAPARICSDRGDLPYSRLVGGLTVRSDATRLRTTTPRRGTCAPRKWRAAGPRASLPKAW